MGKWQVIARIYGYVVCLTAVCWGLVALAAAVEAAFDMTDPLHSQQTRYSSKNLSSFEAYKLDILRSAQVTGGGDTMGVGVPATAAPKALDLSDDAIRAMYEADKRDVIQGALAGARRGLMKSAITLIACIALFTGHWRWLRKMPKGES